MHSLSTAMNDETSRFEEIHLRDYLLVLRKRKALILTTFLVIVLVTAFFTFTATPVYKGTTTVIIEKENPNLVSVEEVFSMGASDSDYYQTQYEVIKSRTVGRETARRLDLINSKEFFPDPDDNAIARFKAGLADTLASWRASLTTLLRGEDPGLTTAIDTTEMELLDAFQERLSIEPVRNSRVVNISFEATDPVLAAKIANTHSQVYIDQNMATKLDMVTQAVGWLNERIQEERARVEAAQLAFQKFKEANNIITDFSSDTEQITAQKLAELNTQVIDAQTSRVEAQTRYEQTRKLLDARTLDSIPEIIANPLLQTITQREVELSNELSDISQVKGPNHPQVISLKAEIADITDKKRLEVAKVVASLKNKYEISQAKERSLKQALGTQEGRAQELNTLGLQYGVLKREAESAKEMYDLLVKRFKEASLTEDMKTGNIRIVDQAEVPRFPVKPKKALNLALALILGLTAGVGLAFTFEYFDDTLKTPEDVQHFLHVPYMGVVPQYQTTHAQDELPEIVSKHSPKATASEAYRGLRTNILFSAADNPPQVIMVTSASPSEGKTLTASNLAVTMAQSGSKTVILDCDMRNPRLHRVFKVDRDNGMSSVLAGTAEQGRIIRPTAVANLDIIPAGPIPPNPAELLGSKRMHELLGRLKERYDRIIIDTPPVTAVTDSSIISDLSDGVLLVTRAFETSRTIVKRAVQNLEGVNAKVLGVILNGVDMQREGYYYYQYYYYYYGEEGRKKREGQKGRSAA